MGVTLDIACAATGRRPAELTRRDVARSLLTVPTADALAGLSAVRRELMVAGNPLPRAFWDHTEDLLAAIAEDAATVGEVRRWLEATGSEPTALPADLGGHRRG